MSKIIVLVGPPGSGKSTTAKHLSNYTYVNQDTQGKEGHIEAFNKALTNKEDIVIDRMNFNKEQRERYLVPCKVNGYETEIRVFHESYNTCYDRCALRTDHPTIKTSIDAKKALDFFFKSYERVQDNEADRVIRLWPSHEKPLAIVCDLDGTLCNIDHRLKWVKTESGKANWPMFFAGIKDDGVNNWCTDILDISLCAIVLCSGRGEEYRTATEEWLANKFIMYSRLTMRPAKDYRPDYVVKEMLLDFEILTRYGINFVIDDRQSVVDMWRRRGFVCLQCAKGDF